MNFNHFLHFLSLVNSKMLNTPVTHSVPPAFYQIIHRINSQTLIQTGNPSLFIAFSLSTQSERCLFQIVIPLVDLFCRVPYCSLDSRCFRVSRSEFENVGFLLMIRYSVHVKMFDWNYSTGLNVFQTVYVIKYAL